MFKRSQKKRRKSRSPSLLWPPSKIDHLLVRFATSCQQFALEAAERAQLQNMPLSQVPVPRRLEEAEDASPPMELLSWSSRATSVYSTELQVADEVAVPARTDHSRALLLRARRRSRSAWLYFPHIELIFLFFAFEGALAAQLAAIRENGCPEVVVTAGATLVSVVDDGHRSRSLFRRGYPSPTGLAILSQRVSCFRSGRCGSNHTCLKRALDDTFSLNAPI